MRSHSVERRAVGRGLGLGLAGEPTDALAVEVVALVVERHGHVEGMAPDDDVRRAHVERNSVEWRVRLHEPTVLLRGEMCVHVGGGVPSQSSHGEISPKGAGRSAVWNTSSAQIIWTHVVPLFSAC